MKPYYIFQDCMNFKDCAWAAIREYERRIRILRDWLQEPSGNDKLREAAKKVLYDATISQYEALGPALKKLDEALAECGK